MAEKIKERKDMTHSERIADHYRVLGQPNPFAGVHSGQARARKSGGGLGSNKGAARYERTSAEDRAKANSDGKFGYFDERNKRYVPALFDAIDGGGRDTRGDKFKGGMFSDLLNDLGVDPYGSQRDRMFVNPNTSPLVQAVARPKVRPFDAAMANQEASFDQPNTTPMNAQEMSFTQPNTTPMNAQEMSFRQPNPTPMAAQEMSFTQPNTTPMNAQELSFRQPVSNPFMGSTYDMPADPRQQMGGGSSLPSGEAAEFASFSENIQKRLGTTLPPESLRNLFFQYKVQLGDMMAAQK